MNISEKEFNERVSKLCDKIRLILREENSVICAAALCLELSIFIYAQDNVDQANADVINAITEVCDTIMEKNNELRT